jgi:hypothetical protein
MRLAHPSTEKTSFERFRVAAKNHEHGPAQARRAKLKKLATMEERIMNLNHRSSQRPQALGRQISALALAAGGAALAATVAVDSAVTVHPDRYVVLGQSSDDIDAVAGLLEMAGVQVVAIDACMPGATRRLMTAVYRLRGFPIHIRVLQAGEVGCESAETGLQPVSLRAAAGPATVDEAAVDRYWQSVMP